MKMVESLNCCNGMKNWKSFLNSNFAVVLAAFWVNFCLLGVQRSNAVIFRAFVDVFSINRQHAAWPSGIFGFFMCVTGALSGFLNHHVSTRVLAIIGATLASVSVSICCLASEMPQFVLLYGALQGIGMGLIVPLTHVILNQNVSKYRACALGIAYSGSSAGSFLFPPLTNFLLSEFGLQGTFLLLGGIMSNSLVGTLFFRTSEKCEPVLASRNKTTHENGKVGEINGIKKNSEKPNAVSSQPAQSKTIRSMALEILGNPYFHLISLTYAIYFSTSAIFLMVAIDFAKDKGIPVEEGVFIISAFSIGDFVGRLTFGWITDIKFIERSVLVRCYLIAMGALAALLPICPMGALPVASVLLGVINGSIIVNHSVLLNEFLGIQKLPLAMGFSTCFVGVTAFLRPLVIGAFRDRNQNYDKVFLFMGMLQIFVTLIWFLQSVVQMIRKKHTFVLDVVDVK